MFLPVRSAKLTEGSGDKLSCPLATLLHAASAKPVLFSYLTAHIGGTSGSQQELLPGQSRRLADYGQEANIVTQELSKEEEVIVGLFLVELLDLFFHLSQLGECP